MKKSSFHSHHNNLAFIHIIALVYWCQLAFLNAFWKAMLLNLLKSLILILLGKGLSEGSYERVKTGRWSAISELECIGIRSQAVFMWSHSVQLEIRRKQKKPIADLTSFVSRSAKLIFSNQLSISLFSLLSFSGLGARGG